ncbi:MAG: hypothetical protein GEV06_21330 [Luteitalea sp.]|nr:hypothetical protein [Luteitalea sp.]
MTTYLSLGERLAPTLRDSSARLPVVIGGCGSGRTSLLFCLRSLLGGARVCQYVDLERIVSTPERFVHALVARSPFVADGIACVSLPHAPREAFDTAVQFFTNARTPEGAPATFLVDELLELRTFESFPGLRSVLDDLLRTIAHGFNKFVFTTRFMARARRLLKHLDEVELVPMPPLSADLIGTELQADGEPRQEAAELAHDIHTLCDGRPAYVEALKHALQRMEGTDPISALVALVEPGGELHARLRFSYELRLHRARGYGALKAILDVLAQQEPLTLTEIAHRLHRTPGSTKDYLSWLEDVDLLCTKRKRYTFADPLLRPWVRVNNQPELPTGQEIAHEVQQYALARLTHFPRPPAPASPPTPTAVAHPATPPEEVLEQPIGVRGPGNIIDFD